jgi:hypothetical protein
MKISSFAVAVVALSAVSFVSPPAANADGPYWFDNIGSDHVIRIGESLTVIDCWKSSRPTSLQEMRNGSWTTVAMSKVSRNSRACPKSARNLHRYAWKARTDNAPDASGLTYVDLRIAGADGKFESRVDLMAGASTAGSQTPPVAAPTPTPTPLQTLTPDESKFLNELVRLAVAQPDRQARRCQSLSNPAMNADSAEFFDLGAWTGEQLYKLEKARARAVTKLAYASHCKVAFGLEIVTNV